MFRGISHGPGVKLPEEELEMNNNLTNDTKAVLLLCGVFGKGRDTTPLNQTEYSCLVQWLRDKKMRPADLLEPENVPPAAAGAEIDKNRLKSLLERGVQLGFAMQEWEQSGIWVISRSDNEYPKRYKSHLREKAPPLLFGVGDRGLLRGGGVAVIGSRNVDAAGESFARETAQICARNKLPVVSGGARGVDQIAMASALDAGGVAIGVVADNLLKKSLDKSARRALADGTLLLISPYHPKARFTVGTAMGRNKLIYALADFGLVVSSDHKKGGTWAGATEELKREHPRPVFVRTDDGIPAGNMKLLEHGAVEWSVAPGEENLYGQLKECARQKVRPNTHSDLPLFCLAEEEGNYKDPSEGATKAKPPEETANRESPKISDLLYETVLPVILENLDRPMSADELADKLNVVKKQMYQWLNKAVAENRLAKKNNPVKYCRKEDL